MRSRYIRDMSGPLAGVEMVRAPEGPLALVRLTPEKQAVFAARLELTGNISEASDLVGISRNTAYELRCKDPEFDAACRQALERATDRLERKVRHRAENGSKRGVWYKGELVGHEREHHDTLSMFMLKAHRPDVYRPDVAAQINVGLSLESSAKLSDAELEAVVARQIKRDPPIDANIVNVINDSAQNSNTLLSSGASHVAQPSAVQPSAKGPKRSRGGGDGLTTRTQRGPKHQQQRASKRRFKNQTKK